MRAVLAPSSTGSLVARASEQLLSCFGRSATATAIAPGRVEVIGNHTDYNGGLVLGASVDRFIVAVAAPRPDRAIRLVSEIPAQSVEAHLDAIEPQRVNARWADYPLGVVRMLDPIGLRPETGFDMAFASSLPTGAGMSSSAALELATAYALQSLYATHLNRQDVVRACRRAENEFVGVPSGMLDQTVSAFGRAGFVIGIDCLAETHEAIPLPADTRFWIFNSHRRHALVASLYETRNRECRAALAALQRRYPHASHLAALSEAEVRASEDELEPQLFLRALHVASENERVRAAVEALGEGNRTRLGRLLLASHESSRHAFENSTDELDFLVDVLSPMDGVFGARLTGGGFGGAVLALTDNRFTKRDALHVADAYRGRFGAATQILRCTTTEGARSLPGQGRS